MQKPRKPVCEEPALPRRGRGRPRAFDRDAALAQATTLFWKKGYEATSILELTEAMGVAAPSLYAAFGSKEQLYEEALDYYVKTYEGFVFDGFRAASTARGAVEAYLRDSASALTGGVRDMPRGCMATLSFVDKSEHPALSELMRAGRALAFTRLRERMERGVCDGDLPAEVDCAALARFAQNVQSGMSILARDGASQAELEAVANIAMSGWDGYVRSA
jgi:AcrR family transcriptional regulator